jgi:hypothetical protein
MAETFLARVCNPTWPIESGREGMPIAEVNIPWYMATSPMFGEQLDVTFTLNLTGDTNETFGSGSENTGMVRGKF